MPLHYELYRWLEAFHVISVVMWMAGMLYLPRLFVYHASTSPGSEASALLMVMERRLLLYIMNPAMVSTAIFGTVLAVSSQAYLFAWFHIKAVLVLCMFAIHGLLAKYRREFALDKRVRSSLFFRILNETVTILVIGIIITVMIKPFN
ncbi:protoporphyrinogen oxidase HemJ [Candidatus Anaplasma sp. TIGMIC]|uniref:protoporphyrinogen oxidase HemJ n=1 Tax=Candidatus Anaplasma sp. TIGMIC TaxID=3020713 RepID=UPI00233014CA|nr:protoporphyrinogen oxidase HemJ [Candidatus Anaplasma sp. TIGMIC]MDB1135292.1 protoporphyrinogen oxidase HemJ [Candidatus Anaplasma sp. TIGMIC]